MMATKFSRDPSAIPDGMEARAINFLVKAIRKITINKLPCHLIDG